MVVWRKCKSNRTWHVDSIGDTLTAMTVIRFDYLNFYYERAS